MRSARSSASPCDTTSAATWSAPKLAMSSQTACGHGLAGLGRACVLVLPPVLGAQAAGTRRDHPGEAGPSASRSAGSTWRRLTVRQAEAMADRRRRAVRCGQRCRRRRPAGTGGGRRAPRSTRPDRRPPRPGRPRPQSVGVWEISSSTTTVPRRQRPVGQIDAQPGDRAWRPGRRRPARPPLWPSSPPPPPAGRRRRRPGPRCAASSSCRNRPAPARPAGLPPSPASTRTAATWSSPSPGAPASAASTAALPIAALEPGGQGGHQGQRAVLERPVGGSRPLRPPARRPASVSGVRRTARSEPTKRSAMTMISSTDSRPPEMAQMCSTTSALVKRADREHNPVSGSTRAAVTSLPAGRAPTLDGPEHTARSSSAPVARPTCCRLALPPPGQQARGQRVVLGRPGGQRRLVVGPHPQAPATRSIAPLASSSASIWALRLENARSWACAEAFHLPGVVAVRPPHAPRAAWSGLAAAGSGRPSPAARPSRTAGRRRQPHAGRRLPLHEVRDANSAYATEGRPPGSCGARTPPPPNPRCPPGDGHPLIAPGPARRVPRGTPAPPPLPPGGRPPPPRPPAPSRAPTAATRSWGHENVRSNANTERGRDPASRSTSGTRVLPVHQRPQLVRLHHTRQPQPLRPPPGPHPRRLPHPDVVLVDAQRHRRDQVLRVRQPRHRQHEPRPPPRIPAITTSTHPPPSRPAPHLFAPSQRPSAPTANGIAPPAIT